jgi:dolichyl-phosphate-mannose--protein O-mannosyl transferase
MHDHRHGRSLWPRLILVALVVTSAFLHFVDIGTPDTPVFDEVYFATFASDYANGHPVSDIHPPLGKILYAAPLVLGTGSVPSISFLTLGYDRLQQHLSINYSFQPFGTFPYVPLRAVSAAFGLLLIIALYAFTAAVTRNEWAGASAAFLLTFDNAFLVETRAVLLNGMYLSLGFLALALLLKRRSLPILGGILLGLSLSVKLIGIVFVGPLILLAVLHDTTRRDLLVPYRSVTRFLTAAAATFALLLFTLNNVTLPADGRILLYRELSGAPTSSGTGLGTIATTSPLLKAVGASLIELNASIQGYLVGAQSGPGRSEWYAWPLMKNPPLYAAPNGAFIFLDGNPIVWALAAAGAVFLLLSLRRLRRTPTHAVRVLAPAAWAVFALLPFAAFVSRSAYLYHYFPALLFLIALVATLAVDWLSRETPATRWALTAGLAALVIAGFIAVLPFTYGFSV